MWFIFFHFYFDFLFSWAGRIFENQPPSTRWCLICLGLILSGPVCRESLLQDLATLHGLGGCDSGWVDALCSARSPFRLMALSVILCHSRKILEFQPCARTNRSLHKAFPWVTQSRQRFCTHLLPGAVPSVRSRLPVLGPLLSPWGSPLSEAQPGYWGKKQVPGPIFKNFWVFVPFCRPPLTLSEF